jgi:predicted Zn finger-like uncharacterized protein
MVITVTCPSCSSAFPVDPAKIPEGGVNARCSSCGDVFRVEKPVEVEPLPTLAIPEPEPVPAFEAPEPAPAFEAPEPEPEPAFDAPEPVAEEYVAPAAGSTDDWVVENEELPSISAEPLPGLSDPEPSVDVPDVVPDAPDPFAEPAPFESPVEEVSVPEMAQTLPAPEAPAAEAPVQGFTFGKRDPTDKAKRLARVLVSDMIMYNAERHQSALAGGTLVQDFEEEIQKSWKEYVEQVGEDMANGEGRAFWTAALNDVLAKGENVF